METYIQSHWGCPLKGRFTNNNSNVLCIILPGVAYLLDRSYLDYTKKIAANQLHMDVYEVEYGFQITRSAFDIPTQFDILAEETIPSILKSITKDYDRYVIIGKSIGTCLQVLLNKELKDAAVTNVYISPLDRTVALGITLDSLVLTGLIDPLLSSDSLKAIEQISGVKLTASEGADHSLDIPDNILQTVDLLRSNLQLITDFIS